MGLLQPHLIDPQEYTAEYIPETPYLLRIGLFLARAETSKKSAEVIRNAKVERKQISGLEKHYRPWLKYSPTEKDASVLEHFLDPKGMRQFERQFICHFLEFRRNDPQYSRECAN